MTIFYRPIAPSTHRRPRSPAVTAMILEAITMWNDEGLDRGEIAGRMGITRNKVDSLIQMARARGYTVERRQ